MELYKKTFLIVKNNPMLYVVMLILFGIGLVFAFGWTLILMFYYGALLVDGLGEIAQEVDGSIPDLPMISPGFLIVMSVLFVCMYGVVLYLQAGLFRMCKEVIDGQKVRVGLLFTGGAPYFGRIMMLLGILILPLVGLLILAKPVLLDSLHDGMDYAKVGIFLVLVLLVVLLTLGLLAIVIDHVPFRKAWYTGFTLRGGYLTFFLFLLVYTALFLFVAWIGRFDLIGGLLNFVLSLFLYVYVLVWYVQFYLRYRKSE
ncbi:hypothetical protein A374_18796 [Fictibacillus macauensis ZFHKF-1]|uniref:Uncharacterized protein n=1 Tax=Fictibacillus macauensis ZFHKF-1 TaxID=1196324 RepID=I8ADU9_9BACL|nr:hypothetical protein [Fictibacillus macauensis]EIT83767.1 hypothetical protein A374_18796 [Fictibacillus macauensis ZFHKF-1]